MSKHLTYQAITTQYLCLTNFKGSRVKATAAAGSVTLHWDDALNTDDNHMKAAQALANKFGWRGRWFGGSLPKGMGNVYVQCEDGIPLFVTGE